MNTKNSFRYTVVFAQRSGSTGVNYRERSVPVKNYRHAREMALAWLKDHERYANEHRTVRRENGALVLGASGAKRMTRKFGRVIFGSIYDAQVGAMAGPGIAEVAIIAT
jgi:hypothetical protein